LEELDVVAGRTQELADNTKDKLGVLQARPEGFPRRHCKVVVPMDTSLLRHSVRLERINKGFSPNMAATADPAGSSSSQTSKNKGKKNKGKVVITADGPAYEGHSVLGVAPMPHLSVSNVQVIGAGFCKMQPSVVSAATLQAPLNDDIDQ
jgi:hypothetical protein